MRSSKFFTCTSEIGVSRGTRMSLRRSLSITSAHRSMESELNPCAMRPRVPMLQGMTTMTSGGLDPLAKGRFIERWL